MDFQQLYNTYYMEVYSYMVTLSRNKEIAEEITQNTFFKALTTDKKHRGESKESTWLCSIAKNLFIDEMRRRKRLCELSQDLLSEGESDLETVLDNKDSVFRIHQVLHRMEEPYKEVFQLRVFGELSFKKIGDIFEKTENWARVTYHRARLKIQDRMEKE